MAGAGFPRVAHLHAFAAGEQLAEGVLQLGLAVVAGAGGDEVLFNRSHKQAQVGGILAALGGHGDIDAQLVVHYRLAHAQDIAGGLREKVVYRRVHHLIGALAYHGAVHIGGGHTVHTVKVDPRLLGRRVVVVELVAVVGVDAVVFDGDAVAKTLVDHLVQRGRPGGAGITTGIGEFFYQYQGLLCGRIICE